MAHSYFEDSSEGSQNVADMKDEEILRASLQEPALFAILVERHEGPLMRAALRIVRNKEESEDIVQEAFVKMYKNADKFQKFEGIQFKSWAYKITINTAITHYRKFKKGEFLTDDPALYEKPDEEAPDVRYSFSADAKSMVAKILDKMPLHLRSVLARYYIEDKSYKTIAQEENISIPTLKMRLFRAKKVFKQMSEGDDNNFV